MPATTGPQNVSGRAGGEVSDSRLHVAIIMDGNGRWAKQRGMPRVLGHRAGVNALKRTVEGAQSQNVGVLTVFGFSTENWRRPAHEVSELMSLLKAYVESDLERLAKALGVKLEIVPTTWSTLMQDFAADRYDIAMSGVSVTGQPGGGVQMTTTVQALGLTAKVLATGTVRFSGDVVHVTVTDIRLQNGTLPPVLNPIVDSLKRRLSVSVTIPELPYHLKISGVQSTVDGIVVSAYAHNVLLATH